MQFDTQRNLDQWLTSPERERLLQEAEPFLNTIESHRVISPYAGWFSSVSQDDSQESVWKQSMIVLLALYPIVMLERTYLNPLLHGLQPALATFIGNAISVTLLAWPLVPLTIYFLRWWLKPHRKQQHLIDIAGTFLILLLYLLEIAVFWNL